MPGVHGPAVPRRTRMACHLLGHRWAHGPQITVPRVWRCRRCGVSR